RLATRPRPRGGRRPLGRGRGEAAGHSAAAAGRPRATRPRPRDAPTSHTVARTNVSSTVSLPPFQRLLDAHALDVHRFLVALVGRDDADDAYQETWLAALRAYPRLRDAANLRSWVLTIAHRKAIDHLRSRRREALPVSDVPERPAPPAPERDDGLWALVAELPTKQR